MRPMSATQDGTLLKQHADAAYWKMAVESGPVPHL